LLITVIVSQMFGYIAVTGVTTAGLIAVAIIWNLVSSKKTPTQVRLNSQVEVFIIPLLFMFIYTVLIRFFRIVL
jgi:hypothetical protein